MAHGETTQSLLEPVCDVINIYEGPETFLMTFGQVRHEAGLLYAATFCQSEVCNGGFTQLFSNSTGVLAPEAVEGFIAIGQVRVANTVSQAISALNTADIRERKARQAALGLLPPDSFRELEDKFYDLIGTENGGFEIATENYAVSAPKS
jgi:hypothetical protein